MLRSLLLSILFLQFFTTVSAIDTYWGGGSGNWDDPDNWVSSVVPTANDNVYIYCDCTVRIPSGYHAVAKSIFIYETVSLRVNSSANLRLTPDGPYGIDAWGTLVNSGTIKVENAAGNTATGIHIRANVLCVNFNTIEVNFAEVGLKVPGRMVNYGELKINRAADPDQSYGVQILGEGSMVSFSDAEISVNHTNHTALLVSDAAYFTHYGTFTSEAAVTGIGFSNAGNMVNYGDIKIKGATTNGLYNQGNIINYGLLRFYNSASGVAIGSYQGEIHNAPGGSIYVWGFQYDQGIAFHGIGHTFLNSGTVNVFTGRTSPESVYFHNGTNLLNSYYSVFEVITYASSALHFKGNMFSNLGGESSLSAYGTNKNSLKIGTNSSVENVNCATMTLDDNILIGDNASLVNAAWMELTSQNSTATISSGAEFNNYGVIYDREGTLNGVNVYNDEGVIVNPLDEILYPETPYFDPMNVGQFTNVVISEDFWGGTPDNLMGFYTQEENLFFLDGTTFEYHKYYYAEFTLPEGCDSRKYSMLRRSPKALSRPSAPEALTDRLSIQRGESMVVYPNPARAQLNIRFAQEPQAATELQLYNLNGQLVGRQPVAAGQLTASFLRPQAVSAGTYLLVVSGADGKLESQRVVFGSR